jgi:tripartite ATP-independent transporter DctP family solute receptor
MLRLTRRRFTAALGASTASAGWPMVSLGADGYTLRMSLSSPKGDLHVDVGLRFAAAVARRSNGQLKVEVYPSGQLVGQQEAPDALASGVIDFTIQLTTFLTQLFPQYQVFDTPFIFKTPQAAYRIFDGPIGAELFGLLETKGMLGLGWVINGFREIETTSKPVVAPADMKGLRIRIPSGAVYVATFQALGAIPVTLDLNELYTGLTQRTVDGQDIPLSAFAASKFYPITRHVAMSNHILAVEAIIGSKRKIEALPAPLQKIVKEEAHAAAPYFRSTALQQGVDAVDFLKKNGVVFTEVEYAAFRRAMDPVYAMIQSKLGGDLLERVSRTANAG